MVRPASTLMRPAGSLQKRIHTPQSKRTTADSLGYAARLSEAVVSERNACAPTCLSLCFYVSLSLSVCVCVCVCVCVSLLVFRSHASRAVPIRAARSRALRCGSERPRSHSGSCSAA